MADKTRALLATLTRLAGPLGPLGSLEQRERERDAWHESLDEEDAMALLTLLHRPSRREERSTPPMHDVRLEIVDAVAAFARRLPIEGSKRIERALVERGPNDALIEVLGQIGHAAAGRVLVGLVETDVYVQLAAHELVALACSLGEVGTNECRAALETMRDRASDPSSELAREIEIAIAACR